MVIIFHLVFGSHHITYDGIIYVCSIFVQLYSYMFGRHIKVMSFNLLYILTFGVVKCRISYHLELINIRNRIYK